jgi:hypothetical protein
MDGSAAGCRRSGERANWGTAGDTDWLRIAGLYTALAGNQREHDLLKRRAAEAADAAMSS